VYADQLSKASLVIELLSHEDIDDTSAAEHFFKDLAEFNQVQGDWTLSLLLTNLQARQTEIFFSKSLQSQECVPSLGPEVSRCLLIGRQLVEKDHRSSPPVLVYS
jgi:hypothetical protein